MSDIEPICTVSCYKFQFLWGIFLSATCQNPPYQQNVGLSRPPADSQDRGGCSFIGKRLRLELGFLESLERCGIGG
jgi:hypothetical protein